MSSKIDTAAPSMSASDTFGSVPSTERRIASATMPASMISRLPAAAPRISPSNTTTRKIGNNRKA